MARVLIGNIKGPQGDKGDPGRPGPEGPPGPTGQVDSSTPIEFTEAESDINIASGESLKVLFGKLLKTIKTLKTGLIGKAASTHKHEINDITNIGEASVNYATNAGTANSAVSADSVAWENVSGKPENYTPSSHTHDDRYYTETEVDNKFSGYLPLGGGTLSSYLRFNAGVGALWKNSNGKDEARMYSPSGQQLYLAASSEGAYYLHLGVHDGVWALNPDVSGNLTLGTGNHRWGQIYSSSASISTSDKNLKKDFSEIDEKYLEFFKLLTPVSYKFKDGTSGRTHVGFISQDVEDAMEACGLTDLEFAGFCKDQKTIPVEKKVTVQVENPETGKIEEKEVTYNEDQVVPGEYVYSLRYEEFIALNTAMIQVLDERIEKLEDRLSGLENTLKEFLSAKNI